MIRSLKINGFRNLLPLKLEVPLGQAVVALVGPNGAGKTSVLEAVSLLGGGRGLLGADAKTQTGAGGKSWSVWAETEAMTTVAVGFEGYKTKKTLVDGRAASMGDMAVALPVIWLAPRLDRLFYEGPADRRDWLDEQAAMILSGHAALVARYVKHKRGRLRLLREGRLSGDWLDAEERMLADAGVALLRSRMAFIEMLNAVADGVRLQLIGGALAILQEDDPVTALKGKFMRSREIDARLERTHAGPDTLDVGGAFTSVEGQEIALERVSSGQHKRTLVRLVLAQAKLVRQQEKAAPVVLIDELGAHLDSRAHASVLGELVALGCQVWVADTEMPDAAIAAGVWRVDVSGGRAVDVGRMCGGCNGKNGKN